jgi:hypothetical protein
MAADTRPAFMLVDLMLIYRKVQLVADGQTLNSNSRKVKLMSLRRYSPDYIVRFLKGEMINDGTDAVEAQKTDWKQA